MATLLHAASGGPTPESVDGYKILGVGLWDPEDKDYLRGLFNPDCMVGRTPYRVTGDELKKDQLPSQVELVSIEGLFDKNRVRTVKQAEGSRTATAPSASRNVAAKPVGRWRSAAKLRNDARVSLLPAGRAGTGATVPDRLGADSALQAGRATVLASRRGPARANPGPLSWPTTSATWTRSSSRTSARGSSPRSSSTPCSVCPRGRNRAGREALVHLHAVLGPAVAEAARGS